jgi:DNA-binding SARP family transcriptional activator
MGPCHGALPWGSAPCLGTDRPSAGPGGTGRARNVPIAPAGLRIVDRFRTRKAAALLAYLACHPGGRHPREALIELLWPQAELKSGQVNLRRELTFLRRQLEPPGIPAGAVLLADRSTLQLNPAAVETDVALFEAALQAARQQQRRDYGGERVLLLTRAVERYRGELLPGLPDEWVLLGRQRWRELYLYALEELVAALGEQGEIRRAIEWARRGVNADPLREEIQHQLIRLLAAAGDHDAAKRQYEELAVALQRETGMRPSLSLPALLRSAPGPAAPLPVATSPARSSLSSTTPGPSEPCPPGQNGLRALGYGAPAALSGTVTWLLIQPVEELSAGGEAGTDSEKAAVEETLGHLASLCQEGGGTEIEAPNGSLIFAFARAGEAAAAVTARRAAPGPIRNRFSMGLYTAELLPDPSPAAHRAPERALQILAATPPGGLLLSTATAGLLLSGSPPEGEIVDRGLYRLRPEAPPERLFQWVDPETTTLPLLPPRALPGHLGHLPRQFTGFFGREEEVARLGALLGGRVEGRGHPYRATAGAAPGPPPSPGQPVLPLVTLTGPGGIGKTRLAIAAAESLRDRFPGGVWFVPLADVTDPAQIPDQILAALHRAPSPGVPPLQQLIELLNTDRFSGGASSASAGTLLLLDNLEQSRAALCVVNPEAPVFVREIATTPSLIRCLDCLAALAARLKRREEARGLRAEMMTVARAGADFRGIAQALEQRARRMVDASSPLSLRQAARLLGAADRLRYLPHAPSSDPLDLWERDRCREAVQAERDEPAFIAAWQEGEALAADPARLASLLELSLLSERD